MREHNLKPHDLVTASPVEMTHKMVSRACKGRRLTSNTQSKVLQALNHAAGKNYSSPSCSITELTPRAANSHEALDFTPVVIARRGGGRGSAGRRHGHVVVSPRSDTDAPPQSLGINR
jgi:hypothetical protein